MWCEVYKKWVALICVAKLLLGLYPQSISAVRNWVRAEQYILRQSIEAETYAPPYITYVPEDLVPEILGRRETFRNLPRYSYSGGYRSPELKLVFLKHYERYSMKDYRGTTTTIARQPSGNSSPVQTGWSL